MLADEIHPADEQLENDTNNNIPRGVIDSQILSVLYDSTQVLFDNFADLFNRPNERNVLLFFVTKFKCLLKISFNFFVLMFNFFALMFNFFALIALGISLVLVSFCRRI